jgi:hypothetical protein
LDLGRVLPVMSPTVASMLIKLYTNMVRMVTSTQSVPMCPVSHLGGLLRCDACAAGGVVAADCRRRRHL